MLHLYPGDVRHLTKEDYIVFSQQMKPYIRPRVGGVKELSMFTDGFGRYLAELFRGLQKRVCRRYGVHDHAEQRPVEGAGGDL